ncbi:MAG: ATP synthase F0 subunit B [Candidatus Roizmanbacteria bacterium]
MEALGIDPKLLIAQILNFGIFYFIFRKFIAAPLLAYLKKQQDEEVQRQKLSTDLQTSHTAMESEKVKLLKEMKDKQKELMSEAKKAADESKADLIAQAHKQSDDIVAAGRDMIEVEKKEVQKQINEQVKGMARLVVEKGLSEYLSPTAQKEITKQILSSK